MTFGGSWLFPIWTLKRTMNFFATAFSITYWTQTDHYSKTSRLKTTGSNRDGNGAYWPWSSLILLFTNPHTKTRKYLMTIRRYFIIIPSSLLQTSPYVLTCLHERWYWHDFAIYTIWIWIPDLMSGPILHIDNNNYCNKTTGSNRDGNGAYWPWSSLILLFTNPHTKNKKIFNDYTSVFYYHPLIPFTGIPICPYLFASEMILTWFCNIHHMDMDSRLNVGTDFTYRQ